jgi:hypothetical protein
MSDNPGAQAGGHHLLALPSEVRLLIYAMIFPPCTIGLYAAALGFRRNENWNLALLATCRTIYAEAKSVFYENTDFHVWRCYNPEPEPLSDKASLSQDPRVSAYMKLETKPQIRKLSLAIKLIDASSWANSQAKVRWYKRLASDLTLLSEAPHLKKVHIHLSATIGPGIAAELDQMINLLHQAMYRFAPTITIHPSLRRTDFKLSAYFDLMAKLHWWVTIHLHGTYSRS